MALSRSAWPATLLLAGFSIAQYPGSVPPPAEWKRGFDSITPAQARNFLGYLAGPETMGRGTGQPGFQKAADYMAARFKEFGLKPVGDNGTYFQNLQFWRSSFVDEGSYVKAIGSGKTFAAGPSFRLNSISAPVDVITTVVELRPTGDSLDAPVEEIAKRIVIVRAEKPSTRLRAAISRARPAAILYVQAASSLPEYTVRRSAPSPDAAPRTPTGTISPEAAWALMGPMDKAVQQAGTWQTGRGLVRLVGKMEAGMINVPNVVGLLEGSDPTLKQEIVGLGSHLDHLGVSGGQIYYGADDDGSGSTSLLQIARAFHLNGTRPKRSLLFMAFCGEEMGLVGSGFYASNPIFPHDKMIAELQMDMVGRNSVGAQNGDRNRMDVEAENVDTIRLVGSKRISTDLHNLILDLNKHVGFKFKYDAEDVYTRSDHYNFAKNGIPIAFLFSGFHPDYHQPTDTIEKINFDKISNAARLFYLTAATLANNPARPRKDVK